MPNPAFSVIIPAYNVESHISISVESAIHQTYRPFEIIVVDDGSTDGTQSRIATYKDNVTYLFQANQGPASARNTGIKKATGDYIAFLDSDDQWLPGHLQEACHFFSKFPDVPWYCSAYEKFSPGTASVIRYRGPLKNDAVIENYFFAEAKYKFACSDTMIIKKNIIDELGGFEESLKNGEDLDLWRRIAFHYPGIGYSSNVTAVYHSRPSSISNDYLIYSARSAYESLLKFERMSSAADPKTAWLSRILFNKLVRKFVKRAIRQKEWGLLRDVGQLLKNRIGLVDKILIYISPKIPSRIHDMMLTFFSSGKIPNKITAKEKR